MKMFAGVLFGILTAAAVLLWIASTVQSYERHQQAELRKAQILELAKECDPKNEDNNEAIEQEISSLKDDVQFFQELGVTEWEVMENDIALDGCFRAELPATRLRNMGR